MANFTAPGGAGRGDCGHVSPSSGLGTDGRLPPGPTGPPGPSTGNGGAGPEQGGEEPRLGVSAVRGAGGLAGRPLSGAQAPGTARATSSRFRAPAPSSPRCGDTRACE